MTTPYYTDPTTRQKIDTILKECATIFSNLGTNTSHDLKSREAAKQKECELLEQIKKLDGEFYRDRLSTEKTYSANEKEKSE
jgi:hypothetical protein